MHPAKNGVRLKRTKPGAEGQLRERNRERQNNSCMHFSNFYRKKNERSKQRLGHPIACFGSGDGKTIMNTRGSEHTEIMLVGGGWSGLRADGNNGVVDDSMGLGCMGREVAGGVVVFGIKFPRVSRAMVELRDDPCCSSMVGLSTHSSVSADRRNTGRNTGLHKVQAARPLCVRSSVPFAYGVASSQPCGSRNNERAIVLSGFLSCCFPHRRGLTLKGQWAPFICCFRCTGPLLICRMPASTRRVPSTAMQDAKSVPLCVCALICRRPHHHPPTDAPAELRVLCARLGCVASRWLYI